MMFQLIYNLYRLSKLGFKLIFSRVLYAFWQLKFRKSTLEHSNVNADYRIIGRWLRETLQSSGPGFIKFGQVLSTRPDLTGEIICEELSLLQDKIEPFNFKQVKREVESQLDKPLNDIFLEFEEIPKAAASIAQVHRAVLKSGDVVAVKVLRPNIEQQFQNDLAMLKLAFRILRFVIGKEAKRLRLDEVISIFSDVVRKELNLRYEAACADQIRENCAEDPDIIIPKVYWGLSSQRVMVSQWVKGISINDKKQLLEAGVDLHDVAQKISVAFFNQAYRDGFFHADLHPGNIMVGEDGKIIFVDFGIVGMLSKKDKIYIAQILYGFIERDYELIAKVHFDAGYVPKNQDIKEFELVCRGIGEPIVGLPANKISIAKLLKQLFDVTKQFQMQTQPQLLLLQKTMVTMEGVGISLYPEVNLWQLAEPWIRRWAEENFGPFAKMEDAAITALEFSKTLPRLIRKLERYLDRKEEKHDKKK